MLEVLTENHIRMARAFGLRERTIIFRYALKLAIIPTVVLLGIGVGHMISGAVFAEIVFARPGVGRLIYDARDHAQLPAGHRRRDDHHRLLCALHARRRISSRPGSTRVSAPAL